MTVTIDETASRKYGLNPDDALLLAVIKDVKLSEVLRGLERDNVIIKYEGDWCISKDWKDKAEEMIKRTDTEQRLLDLGKKINDLFPKGKMEGTAYHYRCSTREMALKLKKFFTLYGNYSDDDILNAAKRFVNSYGEDHKYLPLSKYFVMKNKIIMNEDGSRSVQEVSPLAEYLENKEDDSITESSGWTNRIRN